MLLLPLRLLSFVTCMAYEFLHSPIIHSPHNILHPALTCPLLAPTEDVTLLHPCWLPCPCTPVGGLSPLQWLQLVGTHLDNAAMQAVEPLGALLGRPDSRGTVISMTGDWLWGWV